MAATLTSPGQEPTAPPSKPWGLEAYRRRRLSGYQLRILLGIPTRWDLDSFLKEHQVEKYTAEDFEHDLATIREFREHQNLDPEHDRCGRYEPR